MSVRDDLQQALAELRDEQPCPLTMSADPGPGAGNNPPFPIGLAPWATAAAKRLHDRFGDQVELTVGWLPYPPGRPARWPPQVSAAGQPLGRLNPAEVSVALDGPAVVRSGHNVIHGLLVANHTDHELQIATNGAITASVVNPETGEVVGGYAGWQTAPLVIFRVTPPRSPRQPPPAHSATAPHHHCLNSAPLGPPAPRVAQCMATWGTRTHGVGVRVPQVPLADACRHIPEAPGEPQVPKEIGNG